MVVLFLISPLHQLLLTTHVLLFLQTTHSGTKLVLPENLISIGLVDLHPVSLSIFWINRIIPCNLFKLFTPNLLVIRTGTTRITWTAWTTWGRWRKWSIVLFFLRNILLFLIDIFLFCLYCLRRCSWLYSFAQQQFLLLFSVHFLLLHFNLRAFLFRLLRVFLLIWSFILLIISSLGKRINYCWHILTFLFRKKLNTRLSLLFHTLLYVGLHHPLFLYYISRQRPLLFKSISYCFSLIKWLTSHLINST